MSGDLGGEQIHDRPVLIGGPNGAVEPEVAVPSALLTAETARAVEEAGREPLESYRHLGQSPSKLQPHSIDHTAAYYRFAHHSICQPHGAVCEQIADGHRKIVVRID